MKKILLAVTAALALGAVALLSIDSELYASYIEQRVVAAAGRELVNLRFQDTDISSTAFTARSMDALFLPYLISLHLEDVSVRPSMAGILPPVGGLAFFARGYSGEVSGWAGGALTSGARFLDLDARGVKLSEHQQLQALGFESGILDLLIEDLELPRTNGRLSLSLKDANKPRPTTIPLRHQLFRRLTIPALTGVNLSAAVACESGTCNVSSLKASSSFGSIDARGTLGMELPGGVDRFELEAEVRLSETGHSEVGAFLPMLSNGRLDERTRDFKARITGSPRSPSIVMSKL